MTAAASARVCATSSSRVTLMSRRPSVAAKPELVVAIAVAPTAASRRALPVSGALGITKHPASCSRRNSARTSATDIGDS